MNYSPEQRFSPEYLAFLDRRLKKPVVPNQPSKRKRNPLSKRQANPSSKVPPNPTMNFQIFSNLREDFRTAFASRVLRPAYIAPRIDSMITAAADAILEDAHKQNLNSILTDLCKGGGKSTPFSPAEALVWLWVYVGTVEEVTRRSGPITCHGEVHGQLVYLFKQAVAVDKEKVRCINLHNLTFQIYIITTYLWHSHIFLFPPKEHAARRLLVEKGSRM